MCHCVATEADEKPPKTRFITVFPPLPPRSFQMAPLGRAFTVFRRASPCSRTLYLTLSSSSRLRLLCQFLCNEARGGAGGDDVGADALGGGGGACLNRGELQFNLLHRRLPSLLLLCAVWWSSAIGGGLKKNEEEEMSVQFG